MNTKKSSKKSKKGFVTATDIFDYQTFEIPPRVISKFTQRPRSSYVTRPVTKLSKRPSCTDYRVGPGTYTTPKSQLSESFQFTKVERFSNKSVDSNFSLSVCLTKEEQQKLSQKVPHKAVKSINQTKISRNIKAKRNSFRADLAKTVNINLVTSKVQARAESLKEKYRKLDFRLRLEVRFIQEIAVIKKSWIVLNVIFGFITDSICMVKYKKDLRRRSIKRLKVFRFLTKLIAKFLRIRTRLRYYKGMRVRFRQIIRIYLTSYVKLWIRQRKKRYKSIVLKLIEEASGAALLQSLITKWKGKFDTVRRLLTSAIFFRVMLYRSLMLRWNKAECELYNKHPAQMAKVQRRTISINSLITKEDDSLLMIPIEIKLYYIRKFIKETMLAYIKKYRTYKVNYRNTHRQNKTNRFICRNDILLEYPIPPKKVKIHEKFNLEKMKQVVTFCIKDKHSWNNILYGPIGKPHKDYKRRLSDIQNSTRVTLN